MNIKLNNMKSKKLLAGAFIIKESKKENKNKKKKL